MGKNLPQEGLRHRGVLVVVNGYVRAACGKRAYHNAAQVARPPRDEDGFTLKRNFHKITPFLHYTAQRFDDQ
jgi:hypothetical protein